MGSLTRPVRDTPHFSLGRVIAQSPAPHKSLPPGTKVKLTVSRGKH